MRATETRYKDEMQISIRNICVFSREITVFDYHRCGDYRAEWSIRWILCIQEIDRHIFFFFLAKQKEKLSCELVSPHTYWYNQSIDRVWSNLQNKEHQQTYRSVSSWNVRCTSMLLSNNNYICASVGMLHFHSTVGSHRQLVQATDSYAVDSSAHQQHIICTSCVHSHKRAIWMIDKTPVRRSRVCSFDRSLVRSFAAVSNGSAFCCRQTSRTRTRIDIERERIATCPWSLNLNYTHFHCSQPLLLWCFASPLFFNGRHNALCSFCWNIFTPLPYCLLKWNIAHGVECARAYSKYQSQPIILLENSEEKKWILSLNLFVCLQPSRRASMHGRVFLQRHIIDLSMCGELTRVVTRSLNQSTEDLMNRSWWK